MKHGWGKYYAMRAKNELTLVSRIAIPELLMSVPLTSDCVGIFIRLRIRVSSVFIRGCSHYYCSVFIRGRFLLCLRQKTIRLNSTFALPKLISNPTLIPVAFNSFSSCGSSSGL